MKMHSAALCLVLLLLPAVPQLHGAAGPVRRLDVSPSALTLNGTAARQQLVVSLTSADRTTDRTRTATFQSESPSVVQVSATGLVTPTGSGNGTILVRADDLQTRITVKVTQGDSYLPATFERDILPIL